MTRLRLAALAATLLPLALAGCSEGSAQPKMPPSSTAPPSTVSPSPTPDAAEEPTLPPEAEGNDEAAAEAFVRYFWDMVDYAQLTGDIAKLETLSLPSCDSCNAGNSYLRTLYADGGYLRGVDYTINRVTVVKRTERQQFSTYRAEADLSNGAYTERDSASADPVEKPAGKSTMTMSLTWDKTGFSVGSWDLQ